MKDIAEYATFKGSVWSKREILAGLKGEIAVAIHTGNARAICSCLRLPFNERDL